MLKYISSEGTRTKQRIRKDDSCFYIKGEAFRTCSQAPVRFCLVLGVGNSYFLSRVNVLSNMLE